MIEIPIGWILGIIGTLGGIIATLASVIWSTLKSRLEAQDRIIQGLQEDVDRLSKGCGHTACSWRFRAGPP